MRINEAVEIINGELAFSPAISSFSSIATNISGVKKGCLFIAKNPDEIDGAVALGAYGIIYDKYAQMTDAEIAWIKVSSIQEAIIKLIRYVFLAKDMNIFYGTEIEYALASQIIVDETFGVFDGNFEELLSFLTQNDIKNILFKNKIFLDLALQHIDLYTPTEYPFKLSIKTLFDIKINFKLSQYELNLPSLFLNELASVMHMCLENKIKFDLAHFISIPYMKPNFINTYAKLVDYGQSNRVVISETDIEKFKKYATYVAMNGKWAKLVLFIPPAYDGIFDIFAETQIYHDKEELTCLLKKSGFNFGIILGIDEKELIKILTLPIVEPVLPLL